VLKSRPFGDCLARRHIQQVVVVIPAMTAMPQSHASQLDRHSPGVFEGVFTKRGNEDSDGSTAGAFEEVFVRRGRWRKNAAGTSHQDCDNTSQPTEGLVSGLLDIDCAKTFDVADSVSPDSDSLSAASAPESTNPRQSESKDSRTLVITDNTQLVVKNTFIDTAGLDFDSLKEFWHERKVQSWPMDIDAIIGMDADAVADPPLPNEILNTASSFGDIDAPATEPVFNTAWTYADCELEGVYQRTSDHTVMEINLESQVRQALGMNDAITACWREAACMAEFPPIPPPLEMAPVPVLRLAESLPPPELGSPGLPTVGSGLHHKGECRPCAFFYTRGCENGVACEFCHLCGPGERKKRLRLHRLAKREAKAAALKANLESPEDHDEKEEEDEDGEEDVIVE